MKYDFNLKPELVWAFIVAATSVIYDIIINAQTPSSLDELGQLIATASIRAVIGGLIAAWRSGQ